MRRVVHLIELFREAAEIMQDPRCCAGGEAQWQVDLPMCGDGQNGRGSSRQRNCKSAQGAAVATRIEGEQGRAMGDEEGRLANGGTVRGRSPALN